MGALYGGCVSSKIAECNKMIQIFRSIALFSCLIKALEFILINYMSIMMYDVCTIFLRNIQPDPSFTESAILHHHDTPVVKKR